MSDPVVGSPHSDHPASGKVVEIAKDGDIFIQAKTKDSDGKSVFIKVSSQYLKDSSPVFAAQFSSRWSSNRRFNMRDPLVLNESFSVLETFLRIVHNDQDLNADDIRFIDLLQLGILVDKYMFTGPLPPVIDEYLKDSLCRHFPIHVLAHYLQTHIWTLSSRFAAPCVTDVLCMAYLFNLPAIFTMASRQMMWTMEEDQVKQTLLPEVASILQFDLVAEFKAEYLRLRQHLVTKLPPVFFPVAHGLGGHWCTKCSTVPQEHRWQSEVISKASPRALMQEQFSAYIRAMFSLGCDQEDGLNEEDSGEADSHQSDPCGKFKVRDLDADPDELLQDLYVSMGGLCLHCVKAGRFKYESFCTAHNLLLTWS